MKILFFLGHPAHYHLFKGTAAELARGGAEVRYAIKSKDILRDLLDADGVDYVDFLPEGRGEGYWKIGWSFGKRLGRLGSFLRKERFDMLVGSDPGVAQMGWWFGIPSIVPVEDDAHVIPHFAWMAFPFATAVVAPHACDLGRWERRKIGYAGFQKLAYLHPARFVADPRRVPFYEEGKRFFLVRLSSLCAHHDFGIKGISATTLRRLIDVLEPYGRVFISSERKLDEEFESHRISVPPENIHHVLAFADLFVGDSQSMAVEAAVLGTPSIRFSDFAGRIGVLEALEHRHRLTFGIPASEPERLLEKVREIVSQPDVRADFARRRQRMLETQIDVTAFLTWLIREYPRSVDAARSDPGWAVRFSGREGARP